jgi:cold shock CspA family protein
MMQIEGTLTHWQDDRGFGFIQPTEGGDHVFVHIKAFKSLRGSPALNQQVLFQVETTAQGKKRAVNVLPKQVVPSQANGDAAPVGPVLWGLASGLALCCAILCLWVAQR